MNILKTIKSLSDKITFGKAMQYLTIPTLLLFLSACNNGKDTKDQSSLLLSLASQPAPIVVHNPSACFETNSILSQNTYNSISSLASNNNKDDDSSVCKEGGVVSNFSNSGTQMSFNCTGKGGDVSACSYSLNNESTGSYTVKVSYGGTYYNNGSSFTEGTLDHVIDINGNLLFSKNYKSPSSENSITFHPTLSDSDSNQTLSTTSFTCTQGVSSINTTKNSDGTYTINKGNINNNGNDISCDHTFTDGVESVTKKLIIQTLIADNNNYIFGSNVTGISGTYPSTPMYTFIKSQEPSYDDYRVGTVTGNEFTFKNYSETVNPNFTLSNLTSNILENTTLTRSIEGDRVLISRTLKLNGAFPYYYFTYGDSTTTFFVIKK